MIFIAHRGNIDGKTDQENSPEQINVAIALGFDVEVDVWVLNDKIYLGHDGPEYLTDKDFLLLIAEKAWFHCKNLDAIAMFDRYLPNVHYFWHQNDDYTLTSKRFIWTYPGKNITNRSIIVLPELDNFSTIGDVAYGVCTDYPIKYSKPS